MKLKRVCVFILMLLCVIGISPKANTWFTSKNSNSTSGSYYISKNDNFEARQIWKFKYNTLAGGRSVMRNVQLTIEWEYDIADTGYKTY